ncbi:MAG TPA: hypothetical protein VIK65_07590, partial [Candidatus Limnocylindrales bacterium]
MATKSIACPECGAAVAPGRYACAECGALLAALGTVPRTWASVAADADSAVPPPLVPARPREAVKRARRPKTSTAEPAALPATPATPATEAPPVAAAAPPAPAAPEPVRAPVAPPPPIAAGPRVAVESLEVDEDARREAAAIDEDRPLAAHAAPPPSHPARAEPVAAVPAAPVAAAPVAAASATAPAAAAPLA